MTHEMYDTDKKMYFLNDYIKGCVPYKTSHRITDYGVLAPYMGKKYTRDEIDMVIANLIVSHPYVKGHLSLSISAEWEQIREDRRITGYYQILDFSNDLVDTQPEVGTSIEFERDVKLVLVEG